MCLKKVSPIHALGYLLDPSQWISAPKQSKNHVEMFTTESIPWLPGLLVVSHLYNIPLKNHHRFYEYVAV